MVKVFLVRESTTVPEPSILAIMGAGLTDLGIAHRYRKRVIITELF
jgi:hypothetical protein